MIDASFVEAPPQRNTGGENKHLKETGTAPQEWKVKPHKLAQKGVDARWTKKNDTTFYEYKNHIKADTKTKLIEEYVVTDTSVHDSQAIGITRTKAKIGMMNLTYNICRCTQLKIVVAMG